MKYFFLFMLVACASPKHANFQEIALKPVDSVGFILPDTDPVTLQNTKTSTTFLGVEKVSFEGEILSARQAKILLDTLDKAFYKLDVNNKILYITKK